MVSGMPRANLEAVMKKQLNTHLSLLAGVLMVCSCTTPVTTTKIHTSIALTADNTLAGGVFQQVNSYRQKHGLAPLIRHAGLDALAQQHCEYLMANRGTFDIYGKNVSHFGFEARAMIAQCRYNMTSCSENVASTGFRGKGTAAHITEMWIGSKSHEYTMRESWTHTGIGLVVDKDGAVFCTQLFGVVGPTQSRHKDHFAVR
jgi:uncharacterized protein YkwD